MAFAAVVVRNQSSSLWNDEQAHQMWPGLKSLDCSRSSLQTIEALPPVSAVVFKLSRAWIADTSCVSLAGGSESVKREQMSKGKYTASCLRTHSVVTVVATLSGLDGADCPLWPPNSFFFEGIRVSLYGHFFIPSLRHTFLIAVWQMPCFKIDN